MNQKIIPEIFRELFVPNFTEEQRRGIFTPEYKTELRRRLLRGEEVNASEVGVKTFVVDGGRISGKTQNNENATVPLFFGEKGDIWYCRSEESTIRRSVFQSMQTTLREMGFTLSNRTDTDFKVSTSPFEIRCNHTGNVCQFFAINKDINRTKSMVPPSGRLKKVIVEEANEPDSEDYIIALRSTALRFMDEMGKIVYVYNPPPGLNHWANRYFQQEVRNGNAKRIHPIWSDIAELLDPVVIADILAMKRDDPVHYAYWYGGEIVSLEGLVIWSFDRKKHLIPLSDIQRKIVRNIYFQPSYMFYGVDSGLKQDATAVSAWALFPDAKLVKLSTFYLDITQEKRRRGIRGISHTDQVTLMAEWYEKFRKQFADYGIQIPAPSRERWCFDGAALTQDLMLEFEKATHFQTKAVTDKDIERDIARLVNSYRSGQLSILDLPENQISVQEMETFARDEENEIPEGQSDHTIDADKYATYEYYYNFL